MKRAFLLSMDAIIAVGILFIIASFVTTLTITHTSPELEYQRLYYTGKDAMNVLERANLSAIIDMMPENFTTDCNISDADLEKSILDALGYLWAQNSTELNECAENLTREMLNATLPEGFGYEVLIDDVSLYTEGGTQNYLSRLHTIVSGYELGKPVSGYFASAYISRMSRSTSSYIYFGGYEGDGNVTKKVTLPDDAKVTEVYMEANTGTNFTLYVNGNNVGSFSSTPANFTADNWTICSDFASCDAIFDPDDNVITLNFTDITKSYVGGGFMRLTYNTTKPDSRGLFSVSNQTYEDNYWFPGIMGIINLYSGLRIPGTLNNLTLHLKYNNNITVNGTGIPVYLIIGDTEIFRKNDSGIVEVSMTDNELSTLLNYANMSDSTVPVRLGMETFHVLAGKGSSDVVLITDRSGSMDTCDVWSNESYECELSACEDRCSATCDDSQSICENICGGTWTEVTPAVYVCSGEPAECCDNQTACNQCGGTYGTRERINVAKDANKEFLDTIIGYQGSRAGLSAYGTDVCSYDDLTTNQTYLDSRVDDYDDDCSGTCICCGINKAVNILTKSRDFNMLENSLFTGPSIQYWNDSGTVSLSSIGSDAEDYEFHTSNTYSPDIIHVSGDVYAIAYEYESGSDGWIKTVEIDSTDGDITQPFLDDYRFESGYGEQPKIIHVSGDVYAVFYRNSGSDGWVKTIEIRTDGTIVGEIDFLEFETSAFYDPSVIHVSGDIYAVAHRGSGDEGRLRTIEISSNGNIVGQSDSYQFESPYYNYEAFEPSIVSVSGDIYAIAYRLDGTDEGRIKTVEIQNNGNIVGTVDTSQFESGSSAFEAYDPQIVHVSQEFYAVVYRRDGDDDGWVKTIEIDSSGNISGPLDDLEFDENNCRYPSVTKMYGNSLLIAYRGSGNDGWAKIVEMTGNGKLSESGDVIEFMNSDVSYVSVTNGSGNVYSIVYRGPGSDGWVSTVLMGERDFGLTDYWKVNSSDGSSGSLKQNFTLPTGTFEEGYLTVDHSTSDSYFDGTAYAFCNLTYLNYTGGGYNITTETLWSASWTSADNPTGPVKETVNLSYHMQDEDFTYTLECGADVTDGGGETVVAFDNIELNFTMGRYTAILVMSDGEATRHCTSFDDYTGDDGSSSEEEGWAINSSCNARDKGIEVYSVAFGIGADELVMQKIACWNCTTNDWIPGEEEENCSRYYQSNSAEELEEMYKSIAQSMGQASYEEQSITLSGDISLENAIYSDSFIRYNYTPHTTLNYGEVSISLESDRFGGNVESPKYGNFYVPSGRVLDAEVTSYSSEYWTSAVAINSSETGSAFSTVYNISQYGSEYTDIGDPFAVNIPVNLISAGENNTILVDTALSEGVTTGGSPDDMAIYHVGVEGIVGYGEVFSTLDNATNDATSRLESKLSEFNITALEIVTPYQYVSELPSLWGPSVMEIRIWS